MVNGEPVNEHTFLTIKCVMLFLMLVPYNNNLVWGRVKGVGILFRDQSFYEVPMTLNAHLGYAVSSKSSQ